MKLVALGLGLAPLRNYKATKTINKYVNAGGELLTRKLPNGHTARSISIPYKDGSKSYIQVLDNANRVLLDRFRTHTSRVFSEKTSFPTILQRIFSGKIIK